jgi:hypothetical protein
MSSIIAFFTSPLALTIFGRLAPVAVYVGVTYFMNSNPVITSTPLDNALSRLNLTKSQLSELSVQALGKWYRQQSLLAHPDKGGSASEFEAVRDAYEVVRDYLKGNSLDIDPVTVSQEPSIFSWNLISHLSIGYTVYNIITSVIARYKITKSKLDAFIYIIRISEYYILFSILRNIMLIHIFPFLGVEILHIIIAIYNPVYILLLGLNLPIELICVFAFQSMIVSLVTKIMRIFDLEPYLISVFQKTNNVVMQETNNVVMQETNMSQEHTDKLLRIMTFLNNEHISFGVADSEDQNMHVFIINEYDHSESTLAEIYVHGTRVFLHISDSNIILESYDREIIARDAVTRAVIQDFNIDDLNPIIAHISSII